MKAILLGADDAKGRKADRQTEKPKWPPEGDAAMLRRTLILLGLSAAYAKAQPASEPTPMAAVAAIKLQPNWQRIEIAAETPTRLRLQLYYKSLGQRHSPVVSRLEATTDTREIARTVLDELRKEEKDPAKDRINLSVWAQQEAGTGMTGKPLTRHFGGTIYDYKTDRLEYRTADRQR